MSKVFEDIVSTHEEHKLIEYVPNGNVFAVFESEGKIYCINGDEFPIDELEKWLVEIGSIVKDDPSLVFPSIVIAFSESLLQQLPDDQIDRLKVSGAAVLTKPDEEAGMYGFMAVLAADLQSVSTEGLRGLSPRSITADELGMSVAELDAKLHAVEDISEFLKESPDDLSFDEYVRFLKVAS